MVVRVKIDGDVCYFFFFFYLCMVNGVLFSMYGLFKLCISKFYIGI